MGQSALAGRLLDVSDDARGDRVAVLTAAFWARRFASDPAGTRPHHDHRRCQLHGRRRAPEDSRTARARRRALHGRALAAAEAQGPVLYDGAGTPAARRPAGRRARHACAPRMRGCSRSGSRPIRTRRRRGACRISNRASSATSARRWSSCWPRLAACSSSRARTPSIFSSRARSTAAASWPFAARSAPRAAGSCST